MNTDQQPSFWELYEWYLIDSYSAVEHWWQHSLLVVFFLAAVFLVLESILPKKLDYQVITRKGFFLDFVYIFIYDFLLAFPVVMGSAAAVEYLFNGWVIYDVSSLPTIAMFLVIFVVNDFVNWFGHVLLHKVPLLWKFHKIHHAQEELGFGSTRHFHFVEYLVFRPLMFIPFGLLGVMPIEYMVFQVWVSFTFTFLSHANIQLPKGLNFLNFIVITPDTHYWHHAKNVKSDTSVNYASILTVWDHIFGYFYLPENPKKKPILGLYHDDTPTGGFLKQQLHPFKTLFSKEDKKNFMDD